MFGDELPGQTFGCLGQFPEMSCAIRAYHGGKFILILTLSATKLSAVAPRSAPARFACFKQGYIVATPGKMQRS